MLAVVAVVAAVAVVATQHRTVRVVSAEAELHLGWGSAHDHLATIAESGNDAALARLARWLVLQRNTPSATRAWTEIRLRFHAHAASHLCQLIPHLLRLASIVDDDADRGAALELMGLIATSDAKVPVSVARDGEIFFATSDPHGSIWSSGVADRPSRVAVHAWAEWLVDHEVIERNADVIHEIGPAPRTLGPPGIGIGFADGLRVRTILPGSVAARAGIFEDDRIVELNGSAVREIRQIEAAVDRDGRAEIVVEREDHRLGIPKRVPLTIAR